MSTVATTLCPAILASIATSTELKQTQQKASAMHPDCLRLPHEAHAALSPKLSTTTSSLNGSMKSFEMHGSDIELETVMLHEEISDEMHATAIDNTDNEMDTVSICSDTSELSVGQEHDERQLNLAQQQKQQQQQHLSSFDCSDARSSISTDEPATTPNYPETESPNHEQMRPTLDPFIMANALRIPVPLLPRANNSAFQEEFLRKSQLYAGELMKQQMQLMAAARVNAFTGGNAGGVAAPPTQHFAQLTAISKITQLNAVAAAAAAAAAFKSSTNGTNDALAQLSALSMAQQHTQNAMKTVSNLNRLQLQQSGGGANLGVHHQATTHHTHHIFNSYNNNNNNNNNLLAHETSLKFSIDNILKADFGRRIAAAAAADQKRRSVAASKVAASSPTATATLSSPMCATTNAAIDFSSLMSSASTNFSNTLANICTNSNDSNLSINNNNNNNNKNNNNHEFLKSPRSDHSAISLDNSHLVNDLVKKSDLRTELSDSSSSSNLTTTTSVTTTATTTASQSSGTGASSSGPIVWPAWVYCTRYSDRPSSGPRTRKPKKPATEKGNVSPSSGSSSAEDKRPRTAFSGSQLARLKHEFTENRYLTEKRRQQLSSELGLNEAQIKIWFQNKRAKLKKSSGTKNPLALQLMAQGLYNHSTVPLTREEEELQELQEREREAAAAAT